MEKRKDRRSMLDGEKSKLGKLMVQKQNIEKRKIDRHDFSSTTNNQKLESSDLTEEISQNQCKEQSYIETKFIKFVTQRRNKDTGEIITEEHYHIKDNVTVTPELLDLKEKLNTNTYTPTHSPNASTQNSPKNISKSQHAEENTNKHYKAERNLNCDIISSDEPASSEDNCELYKPPPFTPPKRYIKYTEVVKKLKNKRTGNIISQIIQKTEFTDEPQNPQRPPPEKKFKARKRICEPTQIRRRVLVKRPQIIPAPFVGSLEIPSDDTFIAEYGSIHVNLKKEYDSIPVTPKDYDKYGSDEFPEVVLLPSKPRLIKVGNKYFIEKVEDGVLTRYRATEDGKRIILVKKDDPEKLNQDKITKMEPRLPSPPNPISIDEVNNTNKSKSKKSSGIKTNFVPTPPLQVPINPSQKSIFRPPTVTDTDTNYSEEESSSQAKTSTSSSSFEKKDSDQEIHVSTVMATSEDLAPRPKKTSSGYYSSTSSSSSASAKPPKVAPQNKKDSEPHSMISGSSYSSDVPQRLTRNQRRNEQKKLKLPKPPIEYSSYSSSQEEESRANEIPPIDFKKLPEVPEKPREYERDSSYYNHSSTEEEETSEEHIESINSEPLPVDVNKIHVSSSTSSSQSAKKSEQYEEEEEEDVMEEEVIEEEEEDYSYQQYGEEDNIEYDYLDHANAGPTGSHRITEDYDSERKAVGANSFTEIKYADEDEEGTNDISGPGVIKLSKPSSVARPSANIEIDSDEDVMRKMGDFLAPISPSASKGVVEIDSQKSKLEPQEESSSSSKESHSSSEAHSESKSRSEKKEESHHSKEKSSSSSKESHSSSEAHSESKSEKKSKSESESEKKSQNESKSESSSSSKESHSSSDAHSESESEEKEESNHSKEESSSTRTRSSDEEKPSSKQPESEVETKDDSTKVSKDLGNGSLDVEPIKIEAKSDTKKEEGEKTKSSSKKSISSSEIEDNSNPKNSDKENILDKEQITKLNGIQQSIIERDFDEGATNNTPINEDEVSADSNSPIQSSSFSNTSSYSESNLVKHNEIINDIREEYNGDLEIEKEENVSLSDNKENCYLNKAEDEELSHTKNESKSSSENENTNNDSDQKQPENLHFDSKKSESNNDTSESEKNSSGELLKEEPSEDKNKSFESEKESSESKSDSPKIESKSSESERGSSDHEKETLILENKETNSSQSETESSSSDEESSKSTEKELKKEMIGSSESEKESSKLQSKSNSGKEEENKSNSEEDLSDSTPGKKYSTKSESESEHPKSNKSSAEPEKELSESHELMNEEKEEFISDLHQNSTQKENENNSSAESEKEASNKQSSKSEGEEPMPKKEASDSDEKESSETRKNDQEEVETPIDKSPHELSAKETFKEENCESSSSSSKSDSDEEIKNSDIQIEIEKDKYRKSDGEDKEEPIVEELKADEQLMENQQQKERESEIIEKPIPEFEAIADNTSTTSKKRRRRHHHHNALGSPTKDDESTPGSPSRRHRHRAHHSSTHEPEVVTISNISIEQIDSLAKILEMKLAEKMRQAERTNKSTSSSSSSSSSSSEGKIQTPTQKTTKKVVIASPDIPDDIDEDIKMISDNSVGSLKSIRNNQKWSPVATPRNQVSTDSEEESDNNVAPSQKVIEAPPLSPVKVPIEKSSSSEQDKHEKRSKSSSTSSSSSSSSSTEEKYIKPMKPANLGRIPRSPDEEIVPAMTLTDSSSSEEEFIKPILPQKESRPTREKEAAKEIPYNQFDNDMVSDETHTSSSEESENESLMKDKITKKNITKAPGLRGDIENFNAITSSSDQCDTIATSGDFLDVPPPRPFVKPDIKQKAFVPVQDESSSSESSDEEEIKQIIVEEQKSSDTNVNETEYEYIEEEEEEEEEAIEEEIVQQPIEKKESPEKEKKSWKIPGILLRPFGHDDDDSSSTSSSTSSSSSSSTSEDDNSRKVEQNKKKGFTFKPINDKPKTKGGFIFKPIPLSKSLIGKNSSDSSDEKEDKKIIWPAKIKRRNEKPHISFNPNDVRNNSSTDDSENKPNKNIVSEEKNNHEAFLKMKHNEEISPKRESHPLRDQNSSSKVNQAKKRAPRKMVTVRRRVKKASPVKEEKKSDGKPSFIPISAKQESSDSSDELPSIMIQPMVSVTSVAKLNIVQQEEKIELKEGEHLPKLPKKLRKKMIKESATNTADEIPKEIEEPIIEVAPAFVAAPPLDLPHVSYSHSESKSYSDSSPEAEEEDVKEEEHHRFHSPALEEEDSAYSPRSPVQMQTKPLSIGGEKQMGDDYEDTFSTDTKSIRSLLPSPKIPIISSSSSSSDESSSSSKEAKVSIKPPPSLKSPPRSFATPIQNVSSSSSESKTGNHYVRETPVRKSATSPKAKSSPSTPQRHSAKKQRKGEQSPISDTIPTGFDEFLAPVSIDGKVPSPPKESKNKVHKSKTLKPALIADLPVPPKPPVKPSISLLPQGKKKEKPEVPSGSSRGRRHHRQSKKDESSSSSPMHVPPPPKRAPPKPVSRLKPVPVPEKKETYPKKKPQLFDIDETSELSEEETTEEYTETIDSTLDAQRMATSARIQFQQRQKQRMYGAVEEEVKIPPKEIQKKQKRAKKDTAMPFAEMLSSTITESD